MAQELDLYEANGVSIEYDYLEEPVVLDLVATGEYALGMVSGEQVIIARSQQRPVTMVYEWYQQYPVGVVAPVSSGIETAEDLAGAQMGIPGRFGASYIAFTTLLESAGLTETDVNLQEIGYNAPEVVCVGGVEASVVYINNEPLQIRERASRDDCGDVTDVNVITVASVTDLVSNGIITNEQTIADNPELVQSVVNAFDEALRLSIQNPARAYLLSIDAIEGLPADDELVAALEDLAAQQEEFLATEPGRRRHRAEPRRHAHRAASRFRQRRPDSVPGAAGDHPAVGSRATRLRGGRGLGEHAADATQHGTGRSRSRARQRLHQRLPARVERHSRAGQHNRPAPLCHHTKGHNNHVYWNCGRNGYGGRST